MKYQIYNFVIILLAMLSGGLMERGRESLSWSLLLVSFSLCFPITLFSGLAEKAAKDGE